MEKLGKIPQVMLKHEDGWEYRCSAFSDIVQIEYWEERTDGMGKRSEFVVSTFCAKQLFDELSKLVDMVDED